MEIQRENKTTLLFISHDLSIVRYLSDRVMVMYLGHVVEMGTTEQVFQPAISPVYRGVAVRGSNCGHIHREKTRRAGRRHPIGDEPANGLPIPNAMSLQRSSRRWAL